MALRGVLEWALAMSSLQLPPYVLEHIFNSLGEGGAVRSDSGYYQRRRGQPRIAVPSNTRFLDEPRRKRKSIFEIVNANYFHMVVEERTHHENIQLFISVQKAHRASVAFQERM